MTIASMTFRKMQVVVNIFYKIIVMSCIAFHGSVTYCSNWIYMKKQVNLFHWVYNPELGIFEFICHFSRWSIRSITRWWDLFHSINYSISWVWHNPICVHTSNDNLTNTHTGDSRLKCRIPNKQDRLKPIGRNIINYTTRIIGCWFILSICRW